MQLAAGDEEAEIDGCLGVVVPKKSRDFLPAATSQRIFAVVVIHALSTVIEEAAQRELMSNGIAECLADDAAFRRAQVIRSVDPLENSSTNSASLAILETCRRRQFAPRLIKLADISHTQ